MNRNFTCVQTKDKGRFTWLDRDKINVIYSKMFIGGLVIAITMLDKMSGVPGILSGFFVIGGCMNQTYHFTEGKILSPLIKFTIPILLAVFLQAMYGAVDLLIVGRFGNTASVSAVATGSQMIQTITGIITGLTMGITVLLGQKIGENRMDEASRIVGASIGLFAVISIIVTAMMMLTVRPFAELMNAPAAAFEKTVHYVLICSAGIVFIVTYNVISGIFRGMGNSKLPLAFVGIACVTNIVGDFVLVGIFQLDAAGAAIATVTAQAVSIVLSLVIIKKQGFPFVFTKKSIHFHKAEIKRILKLGAPIALQDALTNVSFLIITSIINSLGLIASAAIGVSEKIVIFIMLIPIAYMSSVSAFVAQNIGAGRCDRAKKSMLYAMSTALVFGVMMFCITFWHGHILAGIFSNDAQVIAACAEYMKAYAVDCVLVCVLFCFMGYFNGLGKTMFVMIQGFLAAFLVRIPFSYFMSQKPGVTMLQIGFASPVATILSIFLCVIYFRYVTARETTSEAQFMIHD